MTSRTIYGLDIETDRSVDGRDPAVAPIVKVALAGPGFDEVFTGSERRLLRTLDDRLRSLPPGVVATWQGSTFDLPFLAERAARGGVGLGLRLSLDPSLPATQRPLIGHEGAYRAAWYEHQHIDACRVCNGEMLVAGRAASAWRSFVDLIGLAPARAGSGDDARSLVDVERCNAANDARLARALIERRLPSVHRHLDRVPAEREPAALTLVPDAPGRHGSARRAEQHAGPTAASA